MSEIKSKVITPEFEEGFTRTFGEVARVKGGRFVFRPGHPQANERGFVPAHLIHDEPEHKIEINVDRNYENIQTQDGVVLNSRRQHREYMKEHGVTHTSDFKGTWDKAAERRAEVAQGKHDQKDRRDDIGRSIYELEKRRRKS